MRQAAVGFQCPDCVAARPQRTVPVRRAGTDDVVVGKVIIAVNVAVFLLMTALGGNPYRASGPVLESGATFGPLVAAGEWWRVVTGAFLHSGFLHLAMNMFLLWLLARELEPALGRVGFGVLYGVSLLGGALGVMLLSPLSPTVGASGAVFGLMGGLITLQLRARQNPWQSGIGGLVLINVVLTFTIPGISIGGHIGGLLAGAVAGALLQPLSWPQQGAALRTVVVAGAGLAVGVAAVAVAPTLVGAPLF